MEFIDDDRSAAGSFLSGVNRKILRSRFSEGSAWTPDHIALAMKDGEPVAMADAIVLGDREAVNAGLLAKPCFGGYAIKALLHLKLRLGIPHWQSTLRVPTDATMAISRRYFTQTYDQATSELASKLVEIHGQQHYLHPVPLLASDKFLRMAGLPPIARWDGGTKLQVLKAAAVSNGFSLRAPAGQVLPIQDLTAIAFDLLRTPYEVRQQFGRMTITTMAAMHGHDPSALVGRMIKSGGGTQYMTAVREFAGADISSGGLFKVEAVDPVALQDAMRRMLSGRLTA